MADTNITDQLLDEQVATTLDEMLPLAYDQVAMGNPLVSQLEDSPYKEERNGGARIRVPVKYGKYSNVKSFGKGEVRTPVQPKLIGFAYYNFKQVAGEWSVDWVEEREQASSGNVIQLVKERAQTLMDDVGEYMNLMFWQSSVGNSNRDLNGLPFLIPTDPRTGILAGYDRAVRYWWRNWYWDTTSVSYGRVPIASTAGTPTAVGAFGVIATNYSTCLKRMRTCLNSISVGESRADYFIITDQLVYENYCDMAQYIKNFQITYSNDENMVKWNFGGAQFMGIPILFDTVANGAESGVMRFINKKHTKLITDSGAWFTWSSERVPYNQFAKVRYLLLRGQLVLFAPWKNGVLQGITEWA